jgi:ubiquinone/menaquinone biosynthesis C-methylase UbiE
MEISHDANIIDQFTKQAAPFAERHRHDDELLELIVQASGAQPGDRVLDVACGPGIVACALARVAGHVTGLDLTPAMLDQAERLRQARGLSNVAWRQGSAMDLPFPDGGFDRVVTRFSFHHYLDPKAAFREMVRVCRPGGTILVADVAPRADARDAYDALEKQRDPSHTQALTQEEFEKLDADASVMMLRSHRYDLPTDVEGLLASSFPPPGGASSFLERIETDIASGADQLGIHAWRENGAAHFHFPVLITAWEKR